MDLGLSNARQALLEEAKSFLTTRVMSLEDAYAAEIGKEDRWAYTARQAEILEGLKAEARAAGLWNFWLSSEGHRLSTVEYAYFAEEMGKTPLGAEVFNCNAPDTGNMEVFLKYGTPAMQARWLAPLMQGEIRSAYAMTEPDVASSDATNISLSCVPDGDSYVLNGEKWWIS
ncbi:MAG: acyl-CoA dehydrogenase family protein, partial [Pseudomonadota bacterium]